MLKILGNTRPEAISRRTLNLRAASLLAGTLLTGPAGAQQLSSVERRIQAHVTANTDSAISLLERAVNINSGTMNHEGVRAVGRLFGGELERLGFQTRWITLPPEVRRAGHLYAERKPRRRTRRPAKRFLLIGHLDTVFEGEGQQFVRADTIARGAGTSDMKGGDVTIIYALKALAAVGALDDMHVIVFMTGDEENGGDPLSISRRDLIDAARVSDLALAFESGNRGTAVTSRRGSGDWIVRVTGRQGHSSGVFSEGSGYGAIYEAARILHDFRTTLAGQQFLTFNPGVIVGGTTVAYDTVNLSGSAAGKTNIISRAAVIHGDIRFITTVQLDSVRATMREIVSRHLPGTSAEISFGDPYPSMPPTSENLAILAVYDSASRALGFDAVEPNDPARRGAGDISFVAPIIPGIDGLGAFGNGAHSPDETVNLKSIPIQTARAALLMYRLSRQRPQRRR